MQCKRYEDFMKEFQYYRTFLWNYRKTKRPFRDHYFHPKMNIPEPKANIDKSQIEWHRVDEFYKAPLFDEKLINIDFVKQGTLGDCSFISALSRVAKQPKLVSRLFDKTADTILGKVPKSINIKCGAVVIFFHAFGQETPVLIDTYLPFYKGSITPIFSRPANDQVSPWFCLVEKAFAKLYGSYSNITGVHFVTAIYSLFGYQPLFKTFSDLKKEQKFTKKTPFQRILEYQSQGAVMDTAICYGTYKHDEKLKKVGLVNDHSYLLIKAIEYKEMNFLNLRNPWGKFEWNGDWSNDSPLWTKQMIKDLNMKKAEDGSFWMIDKDFFKYFTDINVSRPIPKEWHSKTFSLQMWPGKTDGDESKLHELKLDDRPNYVFKITEKVPPSQKVSLFFLIERRPYLQGKVKIIDDKPSKCMVIIAFSNGQKLTPDVIKHSPRVGTVLSQQLNYFKYDLENPKDSITIAVHRLEKRKEIEECSIRLSCKYDFDLYDVNDPDEFIEDNDNSGKIFETVTGVHKIIQQTKKKNKTYKKFYHDDDEKNDDDDEDYKVPIKQNKKVKIKIHTREVDDDKSDDDASDDDDNCLFEKCLTPEIQQKIRKINELDKKQRNLKDEINDLENQVEDEDDEKRSAKLNKKIELKRDEMEKLETQIASLLDDDEKHHKKSKQKFEDESDYDEEESDKKSKVKSKSKKISDDSDGEEDKKSKRKPKPKTHYDSDDDEESEKKSKVKPKSKKTNISSDEEESDKKSKQKSKSKKISDDSDGEEDKKSKRKPKPKIHYYSDDEEESEKKSKQKSKSKKIKDSSDEEESDKKSKRKPKPKTHYDSDDEEESDKKSKQKSKSKKIKESSDEEESDKKSKRKSKSKKISDDSDGEEDKKSKRKPKPKIYDSSEDDSDKNSKRKSKKKINNDDKIDKIRKQKKMYDSTSSEEDEIEPKSKKKSKPKIKYSSDSDEDYDVKYKPNSKKPMSKRSFKPKIVPVVNK